MRLFLIRHGESLNNVKGLYTGQSNAPLTDNGRVQAKSLQPFLSMFRFDKVYSSDLDRAFETSQLALPNHTAEKTELLREFKVGELENKSFLPDEIAKLGEDVVTAIYNHDFSVVGGESLEMIRARLKRFFEKLVASEYETVAAFSHGGAITAALFNVIGDHAIRAIKRPNCTIAVFEYKNGAWGLTNLIDPAILDGYKTETEIISEKF